MSRIHTMNPSDSRNLDQFLSLFNSIKAYVLAPGFVSPDNSRADSFIELRVLKRQIFVRPAWQIEEHDLDICGLKSDDDIILPKNIKNPPVVSALAHLREMERNRSFGK